MKLITRTHIWCKYDTNHILDQILTEKTKKNHSKITLTSIKTQNTVHDFTIMKYI